MKMSILIKIKKPKALLALHNALPAPSLNEGKRKFFGRNPPKIGKKAKYVLSIALVIVMLVSVFAFFPKGDQKIPVILPQSTNSSSASATAVPQATSQPSPSDPFSQISRFMSGFGDTIAQAVTPRAPGLIESAQTINSTIWRQIAANAWGYFQPGTGVDTNTGLPWAGYGSPNITDWDLGVYVQTVIDALKLNLTGTDGDWGFNARMDKVLTFLENRELNNASYPYWFYQATSGKVYHDASDKSTSPVDGVDTGRLFVALNNLRAINSSWASRVNNFVYNVNGNRSNYAAIVPSVKSDGATSTSMYAYYVSSGYAAFWPNDLATVPSHILSNIQSSGTVTVSNVTLPNLAITGDPLLCSIFELRNNDSRLLNLASQVYLAHESYYNSTGQYRAFGEGPSLSTDWEYEWVVYGGQTWVVLNSNYQPTNMPPLIYTKIALSFLALYNTTFATNMSIYLERNLPVPSIGYGEGVDESGTPLNGVGSNSNGLILSAALYAIQQHP
jgi:hypothetical protein